MDPAVDGPRIRARIGVCPQEDTLDTELNVRDNLYISWKSAFPQVSGGVVPS
jgi:ABC-type multidrug transport system ATPase subunit